MGKLQDAIDAVHPNSTDEEWTRLLAEAMNAADEIASLRSAYAAAVAFIDSHVADPDITDEMVRAYAEYQRTRAALAAAGGGHE